MVEFSSDVCLHGTTVLVRSVGRGPEVCFHGRK